MKLYKIYKDNCYPCATVTAILKRIELPEDIELVEVKYDDIPEEVFRLVETVDRVPVLVFENGNILIGVKPKIILEKWINNFGEQES